MRCFEVEVEAKVAQVRLCRPDELNSMVPEFWSELPALIGRLSDDGGIRSVVLSSTGKHFSAGMDLSVFTAGGAGESGEAGRVNANRQLMVLRLQESFTVLERARMPILAAIRAVVSAARWTWSPRATCDTPPRTRSSSCRRPTSA